MYKIFSNQRYWYRYNHHASDELSIIKAATIAAQKESTFHLLMHASVNGMCFPAGMTIFL